MVNECISALLPHSTTTNNTPRIIIDATLGGGGHTSALLSTLSPADIVIGCDVDPDALAATSARLSPYLQNDPNLPTFLPLRTNFRDIYKKLAALPHPHRPNDELLGPHPVADGLLLDLGVSSHQIDAPERGFSFTNAGPLDMRMSSSSSALSAADVCNVYDESDLARVFRTYGDEPRARKIARRIVARRPVVTTDELVAAVRDVVPKFAKSRRMGETATLARVFQSLRIVVNDEMEALKEVLEVGAPRLIKPGGRLVALSYHSLEDRMVKRVMKFGVVDKVVREERDIYGNVLGRKWKGLGKARRASEEEVEKNGRARSAMLRVAERLEEEVERTE